MADLSSDAALKSECSIMLPASGLLNLQITLPQTIF